MKHKIRFPIFSLSGLILTLILCCNKTKELTFQPTWASLAQYQAPDWYKDAKFGIYMHWGPMTVVPWNSVNMGPKRDIVGDWKNAIEKQGLRSDVMIFKENTTFQTPDLLH